MKHIAPMLLAAAASLAGSSVTSAAPLQAFCEFASKVQVVGTVASVSQAPAAPLAGIAVGDTFHMSLPVGGDVVCTPAFGDAGTPSPPDCWEMTIGGVTVFGDPTVVNDCVWGERYQSSGPFATDAVRADLTFGAGDVRAVLELDDPDGLVGIDQYSIICETIFVPSVAAPGFAARLTLQDVTGTELAVIDVTELSGSFGLIMTLNYCNANPNSSGGSAQMGYQGSLLLAKGEANLVAFFLPADSFCFFLVSDTQGFIPNPAGSAGNLCLSGAIGRYVGPGQIQNSGAQQYARLAVDMDSVPRPSGFASTLPGMTWNFSAWYRDVTPSGQVTSNFADGMSLTFL